MIRTTCFFLMMASLASVSTFAQALPKKPAARLSALPLSFERNVGQTDKSVAWISRGSDRVLFLQDNGEVVLSVMRPDPSQVSSTRKAGHRDIHGAWQVGAVKMKLVGSRRTIPTPVGLLPGVSNYFIGSDATKWLRNVHQFKGVSFPGVYPGIDLTYSGKGTQIEFTFQLAKGADPEKIAWDYEGGTGLTVDGNGDLCLHSDIGEFYYQKPRAYQVITSKRQDVACNFRSLGGHRVGLEVGEYNKELPLAIDPLVAYTTYLGGSSTASPGDVVTALAVDSTGAAYVAGFAQSTNFPTTIGSFQTSSGDGGTDGFVAKLDPTGSFLIYSTYIGGHLADQVSAIALDRSGFSYVTGSTGSTDFPLVSPISASPSGGFISKLDTTGSHLAYSTYLPLGGGGSGAGLGIAVDGSGSATVCGTANGLGLLTRVNPTGSGTDYLLIGRLGETAVNAVALDALGNAYVTGQTSSASFPFSPSVQGWQTNYGGAGDAFVAKFSPTSALAYYSYLGGSAVDVGTSIAVDPIGYAYVGGWTLSANFPTTINAFQATITGGGQLNGFLAKIRPDGVAPAYSTYLGGSSNDKIFATGVSSGGQACVAGATSSLDFPTVPSSLKTITKTGFAFVSVFSGDGHSLDFSRILRGFSGPDYANAIALDVSDNVYAGGGTSSNDFPTSFTAFQPTLQGGTNGWLARITGATFTPHAGPAVVSSFVTPSAATTGVTVTASFTVNQPLSADPVVTIGATQPMQKQPGSSGQTYFFARSLDGTEGTGTLSVVVQLQVAQGSSTTNIGTVGVTASGPQVNGFSVSPLTATAGTTITASFTVNETLAADPIVSIGAQFMQKQPSSFGLSYVFARPLNGTEGPSPLSVVVHLQDLQGLTSNTTIGSVLVTTPTGPTVVSPQVSPLSTTLGATVSASFATSEPLAVDPTVKIGSQLMLKQPASTGLNYVFAWQLNGTEGASPLPVTVLLRDAQGLTSNTTIASIQVSLPTLPAVVSANVSPFTASNGTTITATFNVNEVLAGDPMVTIGTQNMLKQPGSSGLYYTYARGLDGSEGPSPLSVVARLQDPQGHTSSTQIGTVQVLAAGTLGQPAVNPTLATIGTVVSISFAAPGRFPTDPIVTVGGQTASFSSFSNLTYTYSVTISAAAGSPSPPVFVAAVDSTGKELTVSGNPLSTDFVAPSFTGLAASPATASTGQVVTLSFLSSKTLKANPTVQVGGQMATFASLSNFGYTYNVTINSFATNGSLLGTPSVKITGADPAGNNATLTGTPLKVTQGPAYTNIRATPSLAGAGVPVTIAFTGSEALRPGATVTVGGQPASAVTGVAPNYSATFSPNTQTPGPVPDVAISGTDASGFQSIQHASPLTLDLVKPQFYALTASPSLAGAGQPVTLGFTSTKPLPAAPQVLVGSQPASRATSVGQVYTYTFTTPTAPPGVTTPNVAVTGIDAAGNVNTSTGTPLTLDLSPPGFTVSASPAYAALGTVVQLTVLSSKPLQSDPVVSVGTQSASRTAKNGLTYTYSLAIGQGAANPTITVRGTDLAGNSASKQFGGLTTIFSPPGFNSIVATPNPASVNTAVHLTFVASRALKSLPAVTIAGQGQGVIVNPPSSSQPNNFSADFTVTSVISQLGAPHPLIAITGVDLAGNVGTTSTNAALGLASTTHPPVLFQGITASPNVATIGTTVLITFTANQSLASTSVTVNAAQASFVSSSGDPSIGLTYTYSFHVTQPFTSSPAVTITGSTGGVFNNRTGTLTVHPFTFDGTSPLITNLSGTSGVLGAGTTALITFTSSKQLSSNTTVTVGGQASSLVAANTAGAITYAYAYAVTPTSPQGTPTVQINAVDLPGNTAIATGKPLTIDSVAPVFSGLSASPSLATLGSTVNVSFTSTKLLSTTSPPTIGVGGLKASARVLSGSTYLATFSIDTTAGTPNPTVTATGTDSSGNTATLSGKPLTTDFTAPLIANITASPSPVAAGATETIQFNSTKLLGSTTSVSVGSVAATFQSVSGTAPSLTYTYRLPVTRALAEGLQTVNVRAIDTLGHVAFVSASAAFRTNFTGPSFAPITATPPLAIIGTNVLIDFSASEPLLQGSSPSVVVGGLPAQFVTNSRLAFQYTVTATPTMVGSPPNVIITGTDPTGNVSQTTARPLAVDFNPLQLSNLGVSPTTAFSGTNVTVTFTANKPLVADPVVVVGGKVATKVSAGSGSYTYQIMVDAAVGEGKPVISVDATDTHGYSANLQGQPLITDINAPVFYAITATPGLVRAGVPVTIGFSSSKALKANPSVVFSNVKLPGSQAATFTTSNSLSLSYTYTVRFMAAIGDGNPLLTIQGVDLAGNLGVSLARPVTTRVSPPSFININATPSQVAASHNVKLSFSSTEGLTRAPVVVVGGVPASKATSSGMDYTYNVTSGLPMPEGQPQASIQGIDNAGNTGKTYATPLVTDYSLPLVRMLASPNPSGEGGTVSFSSTASTAGSGIAAWAWDFGDGATSTAQNPNHVFGNTGTYTVGLTLTSGVGASATQKMQLPVQNVSPTVNFHAIANPAVGIAPLTWTVSDPGTNDSFTYSLVANDLYSNTVTRLVNSAPSTGAFSWDTTKMADSLFQLSITVTDKDGGTASSSSNPTIVHNLPLVITPEPPRPAVFNPTFHETTLLPYFLSQHAAAVEIDLVKSASQSVVTTLQQPNTAEQAGQHAITWDGRDPSTGGIVPAADYSYVVKATDDLGNKVSASAALQGFTITLHVGVPAPTIDPTPTSPTKIAALTLRGGKPANTGIVVFRGSSVLSSSAVDAFLTWSANVTLTEGQNALSVVAQDNVGLRSPPASVSVVLKTTAPPAVVINPVQSPATTSSQSISGTRVAGTSVLMNGQQVWPLDSGTTWNVTVNYLAGSTPFTFVAKDEVGNQSQPTTVNITLAPNPMTTPTIDPIPALVNSSTLRLTGSKGANSDVEVQVRGVDLSSFNATASSPITSFTTWQTTVSLAEGSNMISAQSFDAIRSPSSIATSAVQVDTVPPVVTVSGLTDGQMLTSSSVTVTTVVADPAPGSGLLVPSFRIVLDGSDVTAQAPLNSGAATLRLSSLGTGGHRIFVSASDRASNVGTATVSFYRWADDGASLPKLFLADVKNRRFTSDNVFGGPKVLHAIFNASEPATATVSVVDQAGGSIVSYSLPLLIPGHDFHAAFDGKTSTGHLLAAGRYTLQITLTNPAGRSSAPSSVECEVYY